MNECTCRGANPVCWRCHGTGYVSGKLNNRKRNKRQKDVESATWLSEAAQLGDANAQCTLGKAYDDGQGVPQNYAEAVKWFSKAAEKGNAEAQYNLGLAHANGFGIPQNHTEALRWYRKAAEQGFVRAQCNLGLAYYEGQSVAQDFVEAYKWINLAAASGAKDRVKLRADLLCRMKPMQITEGQRRSTEFLAKSPPNQGDDSTETANARKISLKEMRKTAEQGDVKAQYNLGMVFHEGLGVPQDFIEAYKWLVIAAASGLKHCVEYRDRLKKQMTPEQIAEGQKHADDFIVGSKVRACNDATVSVKIHKRPDPFFDIIRSESGRFNEYDNNRLMFAIDQACRYYDYLSLLLERYVKADMASRLEDQRITTLCRVKPDGFPVTEMELSARVRCMLHLEIESFYIFAKILLDKTAHLVLVYFGSARGCSMKSHHNFLRCFKAYSETKNLQRSEGLVALMEHLQCGLVQYRDKAIIHQTNTRVCLGTAYPEDRGASVSVSHVYPKESDESYQSQPLESLIDDIDKYISSLISWILENRGHTALQIGGKESATIKSNLPGASGAHPNI